LEIGTAAHDIIYCNPCRQRSHLIEAYNLGVRVMSFDNNNELQKLAKNCPDAKLNLRILVDDFDSLCKLGCKFGADKYLTKELLIQAEKVYFFSDCMKHRNCLAGV
jgi:ornithine decarboxylase